MLRLAIVSLLCLMPSAVAVEGAPHCLTVEAAAVRVIDGDTVAVQGLQFGAGAVAIDLGEMRVRLDGIRAPDIGKAQAACPLERARGVAAGKRLREMIDAADVVEICALPRRSLDRFIGSIRGDGERLGHRLIAEGYASDSADADWCRSSLDFPTESP